MLVSLSLHTCRKAIAATVHVCIGNTVVNELLLALHKVCNAHVEITIVKIFSDSLAYTEIECVKIYAILTIMCCSVVCLKII